MDLARLALSKSFRDVGNRCGTSSHLLQVIQTTTERSDTSHLFCLLCHYQEEGRPEAHRGSYDDIYISIFFCKVSYTPCPRRAADRHRQLLLTPLECSVYTERKRERERERERAYTCIHGNEYLTCIWPEYSCCLTINPA